MDQGRGLLALLTEISESAVQRGVQLAAGLSTGLDSLDSEFSGRMSGMADDVMGQGKANTDLIVGIVRSEVDKAVARMGFVREEELAALRKHVERLEAALIASGTLATETGASSASPAKKAPAKKAPAKKAPAKKAPAKKSAAKKPTATGGASA